MKFEDIESGASPRFFIARNFGFPLNPKSLGPKSGFHFWDQSDALSLDERIVLGEPKVRVSEKPGPLFRTML
ncbi:hypothetical protein [Microvirga sp. 2TAF3]|uniref:hypothetical protein n=1 Tax=Microvirga sp. 2TAF3 TaxID=3233014 RepID=UPI003F983844